jgi:SAM-dependent methyltransferase
MPRLVQDRWNVIKDYVRGKAVLDIACVGDPEHAKNPSKGGDLWLHGLIKQEAKSILGVDLEAESIKYMKRHGFDVVCADVEDPKFNLNKKYDVIHAGEIIEHLSNQGIFIENMKRHLKSNGILILSTPNAHDIAYHVNRLLRRIKDDDKIFKYHLMWHSYGTLKHFLEMHGFEIINYWYINSICKTQRRKFLNIITYLFNDFAECILVAAKFKWGYEN